MGQRLAGAPVVVLGGALLFADELNKLRIAEGGGGGA